MKKLRFQCGILILFLGVGLVFGGCREEVKKRPNFLFVLVDDQSPFDLKQYDPNSILETPTIDRLAASGMVFESARHMGSMNGAVCTPSRHMIMTGRSLWHLPPSAAFQNQTEFHPLDTMTLPAIFNRAGYKTMRTCKQGNSYPGANRQFAVVKDATKRGGTEESGSAWHAKQVLEYLGEREFSKEENPFFIYFGFSHPHDTRNGTPELLTKYGATNHKDTTSLPLLNERQPPLQDNYLSEHPFFHGHPELRDEERVSGVWKRRDEQTVRNELGREYACSENIDIQLNRVLQKLEAMGELDNTYIVYTSDHGMSIGRHGLMGKQNLYEHTWKVPFVIAGPGIKAGQRVEGNIYLYDVLPTLCELAGIQIPETVQGTSFKSVLMGEKNTIRDVQYGVYCGGTKPGMRTVRKGDWKLIKYDVMDGAVRETQLFNLAENPNEYLAQHNKTGEMETNLASNPKYADKLREMEALLLQEMITHNDPYKLWNQ
ncbi:sulfatase-like hydrolase/transferase [Reichenbachiella agarivorans]|uniref:Sulfatase-like hydrolase/transferase n=1 Tax=Reichenbachiella agarivorans TaxID=2979464 RepID=A0ABY6CT33_9BACT|nr:sulfatase-like hydrolase/transferase [Reichenbachiella agarivorans]UXP32618.1 sulfatase-like hydrolase/transferase [Reichenbachiella agarivorans]